MSYFISLGIRSTKEITETNIEVMILEKAQKKIPPVKSPEDTVSPSCVICLLQIEEECNKVLVHEKTILDMVL
jgi:hypothetical protein